MAVILQSLINAETPEERIARLEAQIEALKASAKRKTTLKVSEKGGVALYGLGKWPVTLYRSQWERLLDSKDDILAFIKTHSDELTTKD